MAKRGGLGRGLDALIPSNKSEKSSDTKKNSSAKKETSSKKKVSEKASSGKNSEVKNSVSKKPAVKSTDNKIVENKSIDSDTAENVKAERTSGASKNRTQKNTAAKSTEINKSSMKLNADSENTSVNENDKVEKQESEVENSRVVATNHDSIAEVDQKSADFAPLAVNENVKATGSVVSMRISLVEPNREQPRKYFDEEAIEELSDSIRQFGVISPLLVQKKDDYYEIIAGERRWRAAKKAGLREVPVIVREFTSQEAVEVSLIENIQREDLNPIEEAKAYNRLVSEYGLNQEEVAGRVSKSRSAVANSMRLLKLDDEIQKKVETGELSEGHARTLLPIPSGELQKNIVDQILKEKLSVRQTEKIVRELLNPNGKRPKIVDEARETILQSLSENLIASLGTKVSIHQSSKKKGKIEIEYYSDEELERIYDLLRSVN